MKYVYRVEPIKVGAIGFLNDSGKQAKQLGASGEDGWELVCISEGKKYLKYVYCKEVSDEEYETELAKAKPVKAVKPKKVLTPEQIKKRNLTWATVMGAIALACAILAIVLITAIIPEESRIRNEFYFKKFGHESREMDVSPGYIIGVIILAVGIVFGGLSFLCKKTWLWIITAIIIGVALMFMGIELYADLNSIRYYTEELARLAAGGN